MKRRSLLSTHILPGTIAVLIMTSFTALGQNVGVGTIAPQAKLHVAGDLMVDSSLIINGLALKDSTGDLRLKLDPNTGSMEWWHHDTLFHSISVNSPTRQVYNLPDGGRVERDVGKHPIDNTNQDVTAYYDKNGQLQRAVRRYEQGAFHALGKLIFEDVTFDNDTTCRTYALERVRTANGEIQEYRTWYQCLGEFSQTKIREVCKNKKFTTVTEWDPGTGRITNWKHSSLSSFKIDSTTGKALEITEVPSEGKKQSMHKDSSGNKLAAITTDFPDDNKDVGAIIWEGPNNGRFKIDFVDTLFNPPFQFPKDLTLGINQDDGGLTVSNIGSSGCDGVSIDLGEAGKPKLRLFNDENDKLFDLLWELDSQEKDGLMRITDPVTGEVLIVGLDPDFGTVGIGSSGQDGFQFILPTDSNDVDKATFRLFGENGEGMAIRINDTVPPVGIVQDLTIDLDQDNGRINLEGATALQLTKDELIDLLLELDSEEKDGLIRVTDPVTGEVIVVGFDPNFRTVGIGSSGQDGFTFELPSDSNDVTTPTFRLFGENGEGATIRINDTVPAVGIAHDLTLNLDQDNGTLTVGNIGSSGEDGVFIDLGEENPKMSLFKGIGQSLLELEWELDSQQRDGLIRMTDPVTGEVIVVGLDPDFGKVGIGSSGQDGFTFELPSDSNDVTAPTFRLFGENGEGATIRINDTVPAVGIAQDLTLNLDQDNGTLTVGNIGSSGCDGVSFDLGQTGNPRMQLFNNENDALFDLMWEIDSQEKDGFMRMTDPVTGEVIIIGYDPAQATVQQSVGGALRQSSIFDENNGAFLFQASDTANQNNKVQMVMLPGAQSIDFFAGNNPGNPPVNVVVHGQVQAMGNLEVNGNVRSGGNPVVVDGGLQVINGPKNFKIDHPLDPYNKYLIHSSIESPDMMNVYNGNITTDLNGFATVELPAYFEALNRDFRYQLTVLGTFAQAIVKEKINNNQFVIQTNEPTIEVSWQVTGIRQDAAARGTRLPVEMEKEDRMKGQLLFEGN